MVWARETANAEILGLNSFTVLQKRPGGLRRWTDWAKGREAGGQNFKVGRLTDHRQILGFDSE